MGCRLLGWIDITILIRAIVHSASEEERRSQCRFNRSIFVTYMQSLDAFRGSLLSECVSEC